MQMLLFGSFTEDETKLFQGQPLKSPNKSVNKECERTEIQFGTLNFSVLSLEKVSTSSVVLPAKSANSETSAIAKENTCSNEKKAAGSSLPNGRSILANGCPPVNVPANNGLFENVKKTEAVVPPVVPVKSISIPTPQMTLEVHNNGTEPTQSRKLDKEREITENGSPIVDTPIAAAPAEEAVTNLNKKTSQNMPLIPQGLRNTGNICFLNATLQALLSCSPFVHLLQDLRNRSIPKVLVPNQIGLMQFWRLFDFLSSDHFFHFSLATQLCVHLLS
jgi:ubiquitin carboxyl-terminal hydrolase 10